MLDFTNEGFDYGSMKEIPSGFRRRISTRIFIKICFFEERNCSQCKCI